MLLPTIKSIGWLKLEEIQHQRTAYHKMEEQFQYEDSMVRIRQREWLMTHGVNPSSGEEADITEPTNSNRSDALDAFPRGDEKSAWSHSSQTGSYFAAFLKLSNARPLGVILPRSSM